MIPLFIILRRRLFSRAVAREKALWRVREGIDGHESRNMIRQRGFQIKTRCRILSDNEIYALTDEDMTWMRLMIDAHGGRLCGLVLCRLERGKLVYVSPVDPDYEIQYPEGPATFPWKEIERFPRRRRQRLGQLN